MNRLLPSFCRAGSPAIAAALLAALAIAGCGDRTRVIVHVRTVTQAAAKPKPPVRWSRTTIAAQHYRECKTEGHHCQDIPQASRWQRPIPTTKAKTDKAQLVEARHFQECKAEGISRADCIANAPYEAEGQRNREAKENGEPQPTSPAPASSQQESEATAERVYRREQCAIISATC